MEALVLVGSLLGYVSWSACLPHWRRGTLPYIQGFNLFSTAQNFIVIPVALIKVLGLWPGLGVAGAGVALSPVILAPTLGLMLNKAVGWREMFVLAIFSLVFWLNVILAIAALVTL